MNKLFAKVAGILLVASTMAFTTQNAHAQSIADFFKNLKKSTTQKSGSTTNAGLSNTDIASGLKQALEIGAKTASNNLSQKDGFFGNSLVKIPLPPDAEKVASVLRSAGMGKLVDDAVLSMNRAAEDAASKAVPIFVSAITGMTIQDGVGILKGSNDAAARYLEQKTTLQLTDAFSPVINQSLQKVGATKAWKQVFDTYNRLPLVNRKVNSDLGAYVTEKALQGLFKEVAAEELKIRTNPAARTTELLKKVFK